MNNKEREMTRCLIGRILNVPPDNIIVKVREINEKYNFGDTKEYDREHMGATEFSKKYCDRFEVPGALSINNFSEYEYKFFFAFENIPSEEAFRSEAKNFLRLVISEFLKEKIYE
jgi:hypothetical protein